MKSTKKSLLASGLCLLVCAALLVGTTFAWFTDSVTNKGNSIQAGSLLINAYAYKLGDGGQTCTIPGVNNGQAFTFEAIAQDLKTDATPIISEQIWEPGASSAKLLQVTNDGTLAAKISLQFATSGDLTNALWFDFIQIDENGDTVGQFTQRPMNTLATFAENLELPLDSGATVRFVLVYGMYTTAGSEYMGDSFTADVTILAKQAPKEADGFGNINYDSGAKADTIISSAEQSELLNAAINMQTGDRLVLTEDITLTGSGRTATVRFDYPVQGTLDFGEKTITGKNGNISLVATNGSDILLTNGTLTAEPGTYCTIGADGGNVTAQDMTLINKTPYGNSIKVWANSVVTLNNVTSTSIKGGAIEATGGTVYVNGGTFTQTGYYDHNSGIGGVSNGGLLSISDMKATSENYCLYVFNSGGTIRVYDGTFTATGANGGKGVVIKADASIRENPSVIEVFGGTFDGLIQIASGATLTISGGSFANTGLTLEQFKAYVAPDCTVTEQGGAYIVK